MYVLKEDIPFEVKMLWASVLRRAVFDYALYKGVGSHSLIWKKAVQYIFTVGLRYEDGFSFEEVCSMFGWDPDYLRRLTVQLTRADVKKMETAQFRGDFVFDVVELVVEKTGKWKTTNFAVPFCPFYCVTDEYKDQIARRPIQRERLITGPVPLVKWQTVTVNG
jgi:hypothetical protein